LGHHLSAKDRDIAKRIEGCEERNGSHEEQSNKPLPKAKLNAANRALGPYALRHPHLFFELRANPACRTTSILPKVNPSTTRVRNPRSTPLRCARTPQRLLCAEVRGRADEHGGRFRRADRLPAVGDRALWHSRYVGPQFESLTRRIFS
jgi:hypothetical protein